MKPLTAPERTSKNKLLCVAWEFLACQRGTLWQVEESLWAELFEEQNYTSDRKWHPGLCLAIPSAPQGILPNAIMTLGTSGRSGPLVIEGVTEEVDANYPTSFGALIAPVAGREFVCQEPSEDAGDKPGGLFRRARIKVNWHKRRLGAEEEKRMNEIFPSWLWQE